MKTSHKQQMEFFKKLSRLCKEYNVSSISGATMAKAIVYFENNKGSYYYVDYSNNWSGPGDETHCGLSISKFTQRDFIEE